jgi:hypothetical protein
MLPLRFVHLTRHAPRADTDFVPLFLFALFTSAQYLQVGAVAIISLLTNHTVSQILASETAVVEGLKAAASRAAKAYAAQRDDAVLASLSAQAMDAYNDASVELIQTQIDTATLLAFYVGIFSFFIGILKLGSVMNLMSPAVISGFQSAASIRCACVCLARAKPTICMLHARRMFRLALSGQAIDMCDARVQHCAGAVQGHLRLRSGRPRDCGCFLSAFLVANAERLRMLTAHRQGLHVLHEAARAHPVIHRLARRAQHARRLVGMAVDRAAAHLQVRWPR